MQRKLSEEDVSRNCVLTGGKFQGLMELPAVLLERGGGSTPLHSSAGQRFPPQTKS